MSGSHTPSTTGLSGLALDYIDDMDYGGSHGIAAGHAGQRGGAAEVNLGGRLGAAKPGMVQLNTKGGLGMI